MREALFASLGALEGPRVLDLFAGTGALGIEALSRGATSVVFVESAREALACLRSNLAALALGEPEARVLRADARAALRRLAGEGARFELVLLDPPYAAGLLASALQGLVELALLAPGARVVVESAQRIPVPEVPGLSPIAARRYGDTTLTQLEAVGPGRTSRTDMGGPARA